MGNTHCSSNSNAKPEKPNDQPPTDTLKIKETQSLHGTTPGHHLRRRRRALWLLLLYLPVLILPWIFTCIMMFRPLMKPSYINQAGEYSLTDIYIMQRWNTATDILHNIASILAVPVVSGLLAYGAVIYTQRRKASQDLNIRQMFTLADRGWTDVPLLWSAFWKPSQKQSSRYLWYGASLILLASIQPPLRQLLVQDETMTVMTCVDQPVVSMSNDATCRDPSIRQRVVGYDPEPQSLELCPQNTVVQQTRNKIIDVRPLDIQPHLWREVHEHDEFTLENQESNTFQFYYDAEMLPDGVLENRHYFISPLNSGTTTGVLREHAIRMDTNVKCVVEDSFPEHCTGDRPFTTNFTSPFLEAAVCGEGNYERFPWKNSRDKQEINERLWMHMKVNADTIHQFGTVTTRLPSAKNFTMRCDAISTRGWFEIGNYQNDNSYQPMHEVWPSPETMEHHFNDIGTDMSKSPWPVKEEPSHGFQPYQLTGALDPFSTSGLQTPGPLLSAALALFGNGSLLHTARETAKGQEKQTIKHICQHLIIPFMLYDEFSELGHAILESRCELSDYPDDFDEDAELLFLPELVGGFMQLLHSPTAAKQLLELTAFFANEALLTTTGEVFSKSSREIYSSPGYTLLKPHKSIPGLVVISFLICLQIAGLLALARFIYSAPSWTLMFDAKTLARIGAQLSDQGKELDDISVSGLVGIGEREELRRPRGAGPPIRRRVKILALGEPGNISKLSASEWLC